jgi:molecular chaperone GrpE
MNGTDEEFVPEEEAATSHVEGEDDEGSGPSALKSLRDKLKKAVEEKQEYLEGWQRSRADFANYKREEATLQADKESRIKAEFMDSLLPALDALELAVKHHDDPTLKMVEKQFLDSLKRMGVERFGAVGEDFDPHRHEALAMKGENHVVQSVERCGYQVQDKVFRPAKVIL